MVLLGLPQEGGKLHGFRSVRTRSRACEFAILIDPSRWQLERHKLVNVCGTQIMKAIFVRIHCANQHRVASTGSSTRTVPSPDSRLQIVITKKHRGLASGSHNFHADERRAVFQSIAGAIDSSLPWILVGDLGCGPVSACTLMAYGRAGQSPISDCHSVVDDMKIAYAVGSGLELSGSQIPDVAVDNTRLVQWSLH